jgi:hypothetical protein
LSYIEVNFKELVTKHNKRVRIIDSFIDSARKKNKVIKRITPVGEVFEYINDMLYSEVLDRLDYQNKYSGSNEYLTSMRFVDLFVIAENGQYSLIEKTLFRSLQSLRNSNNRVRCLELYLGTISIERYSFKKALRIFELVIKKANVTYINKYSEVMVSFFLFNSRIEDAVKLIKKFGTRIDHSILSDVVSLYFFKERSLSGIPKYIISKVIFGNENAFMKNSRNYDVNTVLDVHVRSFIQKGKKKLRVRDVIKCFEIFLSQRVKLLKNIDIKTNKNSNLLERYILVEDGDSLEVETLPFLPRDCELAGKEIFEIDVTSTFFDLKREFENSIRNDMNLPGIGEGWVSEMLLLDKISTWFPGFEVIHQWSPVWLGRQRIDVGIPELNIGIEYHGKQHFEPIEYFGGKSAFKNQLERDKVKRMKCEFNAVQLIELSEGYDDYELIEKIFESINVSL